MESHKLRNDDDTRNEDDGEASDSEKTVAEEDSIFIKSLIESLWDADSSTNAIAQIKKRNWKKRPIQILDKDNLPFEACFWRRDDGSMDHPPQLDPTPTLVLLNTLKPPGNNVDCGGGNCQYGVLRRSFRRGMENDLNDRIMTSFLNTVDESDNKIYNLLNMDSYYGCSYLEYIKRDPPEHGSSCDALYSINGSGEQVNKLLHHLERSQMKPGHEIYMSQCRLDKKETECHAVNYYKDSKGRLYELASDEQDLDDEFRWKEVDSLSYFKNLSGSDDNDLEVSFAIRSGIPNAKKMMLQHSLPNKKQIDEDKRCNPFRQNKMFLDDCKNAKYRKKWCNNVTLNKHDRLNPYDYTIRRRDYITIN